MTSSKRYFERRRRLPEGEDGREWTEKDEEDFVQELINVQLEKVNQFQVDTYKSLRDRTSECEAKLEPVAVSANSGQKREDAKAIAEEVLKVLDSISKEVSELEKYARLISPAFSKLPRSMIADGAPNTGFGRFSRLRCAVVVEEVALNLGLARAD